MDEYANVIAAVAQQNNEWSAAQAQKQMDFQERMSNTAHQREIADLKAAGLNPVLSAKLGGASTPSGAMGSTDTSLTSSLVDLLKLSMETANSAAGAAKNSSGNVGLGFSGDSAKGLYDLYDKGYKGKIYSEDAGEIVQGFKDLGDTVEAFLPGKLGKWFGETWDGIVEKYIEPKSEGLAEANAEVNKGIDNQKQKYPWMYTQTLDLIKQGIESVYNVASAKQVESLWKKMTDHSHTSGKF